MTALNQNIKQFVATGEKFFIGASVAVGMTVAVTAPAMAAGLTGASVSGSDIIKYDVNGTQTYANSNASLDSILQGNSSAPGGNLELFASSETIAGQALFYNGATTSVSGTVGGQELTLSSLNAADWFTTSSGGYDDSYGADTLATRWFTEFWNNGVTDEIKTNGISITKTVPFLGEVSVQLNAQQTFATAFTKFGEIGGFARSSDPNISYAIKEGNDIKIGLAGHYDLKAFYTQPGSGFEWLAEYLVDGFQASEVVKYTYRGKTDYLYSFNATESKLLETDGWSHNGNYEVTISKDVPEPITGLIAAAGLGGAALRRTKKSNKSKKS